MLLNAHTVSEISADEDKYFELYTLLYSTTLSYIHNCVKLKVAPCSLIQFRNDLYLRGSNSK